MIMELSISTQFLDHLRGNGGSMVALPSHDNLFMLDTCKFIGDLKCKGAQEWIDAAERSLQNSLVSQEKCQPEVRKRIAICIIRGMLSRPKPSDRARAYVLLNENEEILKELFDILSMASQCSSDFKDFVKNDDIENVRNDLVQNGVAVWQGMFADSDLIDKAKNLGESLYEEHVNLAYKFSGDDTHEIQAPTTIWGEGRKYLFAGELDNSQGRYRTQFPVNGSRTGNEIVDNLFFDPRIQEIVANYYRSEIREEYFLFELLKPASEHQKLHIDGLKDQMKVMILLDDVTPEDGPLIFRKKSMKASDTIFPHFESWFKQADDHPDTDLDGLNNQGLEEWVVTGKKGDCIFFDTSSLHRGSPCTTGMRHNVVLTFSAKTLRSMIMLPLIRQAIPAEEFDRLARKDF